MVTRRLAVIVLVPLAALAVDVPAGVPPAMQSQIVEIPGHVISDTTNGYAIPDRWRIVQMGAGVFQSQRLPSEFRRK